MLFWPFTFDRPWFLSLLVLLPMVLGWGYPRLAGLGSIRRFLALALRSLVLLALILALADLHLRWRNDRVTVLFLLDQSASIPVTTRELMVRYVRQEVDQHRRSQEGDRAGVIAFGRSAVMEIPPLDDRLPIAQGLDNSLDLAVDATNLESAFQLAQATFPEDAAKRIVVITDGNENIGNAADAVRRMASDGVLVDVIAVRRPPGSDVLVEHIVLPSDLRRGQSFEARVVLNCIQSAEDGTTSKAPVEGKLRIQRRRGGVSQTVSEQDVELVPGKTVLSFRDELDAPDFYEYEAAFIPKDPASDPVRQNNSATAFTHIRGNARILVLEDSENRGAGGVGESAYLLERLNAMNMEVTVQFTDELFVSLAELQPYDCVIMANVSRSSLTGENDLANFSDAQIEMLVQNTRQMGCGLIMLGGKNSFGAGGWANTPLEAAMPVDFQIKNSKVQAIGALAMVMHASEMANGNHWQKVIAREALKVLGPFDYCGVIHWGNTGEEWLWNNNGIGLVRVGQNKPQMLARLDRMTPGDMPDFEPSLRLAAAGFSAVSDAAVKHMIVISDGDPTPPQFLGGALSQLKKLGVNVTTVAVGTHGDPVTTPLKNIANITGGKYYIVKSAKALPRIFQREARRVSKPLIVEQALQPQLFSGHEIVRNVENIPPITGFVMTTIKKNPLVEVLMQSPYPAEAENATLLATWTYGVGRVAALTTDGGARWSTAWTSWEQYDKFFGQLVRWTMRPTQDLGNYAVTTQFTEGRVKVVVDVLEEVENTSPSLLSGSYLDPQLKSNEMPLQRISPSRFQGEIQPQSAGSYFVTIRPGPNAAPIRVGVDVPYSPEYRYREANEPLLKYLASAISPGGRPGLLHPLPLAEENLDELAKHDAFRRDLPPSVASRQFWPWLLVVAGYAFFADIFVRRVAIDVRSGIQKIAQGWRKFRRIDESKASALENLRQRKAEVAEQIDRQRSSSHFEPTGPEEEALRAGIDPLAAAPAPDQPKSAQASPASPSPVEDQESFTARLLRAKQEVKKDRPPTSPGD